MHVELKNAVSRLRGGDVTPIQIALDFVVAVSLFKGCQITTFVGVLEEVLEGAEGDNTLSISMTEKAGDEIRRIWDQPSVVSWNSVDPVGSPIVRAVVSREPIFIHDCGWAEVLRKSALAFAILLADGISLGCTGAMYHTLHDDLKQLGLLLWIRPSSPYTGVNGFDRRQLVQILEKDEAMHMWQTTLLEFDRIHICYRMTKNTMLVNLI
jgi:hypothetical protein